MQSFEYEFLYGKDPYRKYKEARSIAKKEVLQARFLKRDPYLPSLENDLKGYRYRISERPFFTGYLQPERILGTVDSGRRYCFSHNFMPLQSNYTGDFISKWIKLYNTQAEWLSSSSRIELFEFLRRFYVKEGNKRTSIARFAGIRVLNAQITRIIPEHDGSDPRVEAYYEYLDFEAGTGISTIWFSRPGGFHALEKLIDEYLPKGKNRYEFFLKDMYSEFYDNLRPKKLNEVAPGDLFLQYMRLIPGLNLSPKQVRQYIKKSMAAVANGKNQKKDYLRQVIRK
ncbi:MAG: hypothetical protein K9J83_06130 [Desulfarculaceae bacterium]|nr:hypothetical protein [Desulfarculaceae bacterium]